jgi:F-type H+-transporting ATPase subunit delta
MPLIERQPDALANTYATSLFELALDRGGRELVEEILGELEDLLELARADRAFNEFLASRVIAKKDREASLRAILQGKVQELTLSFLLLLNAKERLTHLPAIIGAFDQLVQTLFGRVEVDVFVPSPIEANQLAAIRDRLSQLLKKEVIVHPYAEASMIGGVKFRIGDRLIDGSVATQLRKVRERLAEHGAANLRAKADRAIEGDVGGE